MREKSGKKSIDEAARNENFNDVSAILMNASNSYDTLKLFKPKPKESSDELHRSDKVT